VARSMCFRALTRTALRSGLSTSLAPPPASEWARVCGFVQQQGLGTGQPAWLADLRGTIRREP
jgi:hypothetical protein